MSRRREFNLFAVLVAALVFSIIAFAVVGAVGYGVMSA